MRMNLDLHYTLAKRLSYINVTLQVDHHARKYFPWLVLKPISYKNNAKPPIVTRNLHDPAPIFQANTHKNTGQNRANFV